MGVRVEAAKKLPGGHFNPFVHVQYTPPGSTHPHILAGCIRDEGESLESYLLDVGNELAEQVLRCNENRHNGHGQTHTMDDAKEAFESAIRQLLTKDYWQEFVDIQRKIEHRKIWGGPVPSLVFQPKVERPDQWQVYITHPETGLPTPYDISEYALELPPPDPKHYKKGEYNWLTKRTPGEERLK